MPALRQHLRRGLRGSGFHAVEGWTCFDPVRRQTLCHCARPDRENLNGELMVRNEASASICASLEVPFVCSAIVTVVATRPAWGLLPLKTSSGELIRRPRSKGCWKGKPTR